MNKVCIAGLSVIMMSSLAQEPSHQAPTKQPYITLFAHGLGADNRHGKAYESYHMLSAPLRVFDFQDSPAHGTQIKASCLGQSADMQMLLQEHDKALLEAEKIIWYGVSRGAATAINTMKYAPKNVAALILESPFDHVDTVVQHKLKNAYLGWLPGSSYLSSILLKSIFANYNPQAEHPCDMIVHIPADTPVLIIATQQDSLIPARSSRKLYSLLKKAGHKKVHYLEVKMGAHANIIGSASENEYRNTVHAFLKKYNLPHNPSLAALSNHKDLK